MLISRMMGGMIVTVPRRARRVLQLSLFFLALGWGTLPDYAQVDYSVHFEMDKPSYLLGEPVFCRFVIRNTGSTIFAFRYRSPTRAQTSDYDQEPRFRVTDSHGVRLPDPGPRPCGGSQGTAVYGYVTLPPGQTHTESWLLNQWAQFASPGRYQVRAERRLALFPPDPQAGKFSEKAGAFSMAINELNLELVRGSSGAVEAAFQPYLAAVKGSKDPNPAEAVTVLTSLPQPFFLDQLVAIAKAGKPDRWDRRNAVDGLARLNTPASWAAILKLVKETDTNSSSRGKGGAQGEENPVRSYALLLLAEKGDPAFIPAFVELLAKSDEPMRGEILRALGFFHDARAYQPLFDNLHSAQATDRMNAILGLKNLGTKEVIPALLAALNDPEVQVRQVANFALEGLTGYKVVVSPHPTREESERIAKQWHAWWLQHAGSFSPPRPAPCHDW